MFMHKKTVDLCLDYIKGYFKPEYIFLHENVENTNEIFCTFSVEGTYDLMNKIIIIHRKTETNTFYTINALNKIIENINNGQMIKNHPIDWTLYKNQLLLFKNNELEYISFDLIDKIKS